ncbi:MULTISPECIES: class I SAM-dependent methyltransferase [Streptomyces]|uniref:class I SAM-dependent methyltransferase n=1 Tax=Streptomyces TaxID=1883 RepID=UPI00068C4794|nr:MULTISPECIES: class I SAM-dependent methyltransferase [Streptomyces]
MEGTVAEDWVSVFRQRQVWDLSPEQIEQWIARNKRFFSVLSGLLSEGDRVLELGCGPGRHAIAQATRGYRVTAIDNDPAVLEQARVNARRCAPGAEVEFLLQDMDRLDGFAEDRHVDAITHGGLMEHYSSRDAIRKSLHRQLAVAAHVVFDVPIDTPKNRELFVRDTIFRQIWTAEEWVEEVLSGFAVAEWHVESHESPSMTDDLIVFLRR